MKSNINASLDAIDSAIGETTQVAEAMANGDVTQRITGNHAGRLNDLKSSLNRSLERLQDTLSNIMSNANLVGTSARKISQGSLQLSERTNEQAASLEETAASMNEMASTVEANASNATQADTLAQDSRVKAEQNMTVVQTTVTAMDQIGESNQKIAAIITLIDGITFQANLLGLNAPVEAAKDIRGLIEASSTHVNEGNQLINQVKPYMILSSPLKQWVI